MDNNKVKKNDDILEKLVHINRITKVVKGDVDLVSQHLLLSETSPVKLE